MNSVLSRIRPDTELEQRITSTIDRIEEIIEPIRIELAIEFTFRHVGSTAKGTHLQTGDIDIFLGFDPAVPEKRLRETIFSIGKRILDEHTIRYAEHPYVRGWLNGLEVDLVPCYNVESGNRIISAVDRTPFHTKYVISRLTDQQKDEVRLMKQFLKGIGCYGAENKTMGFSGYLSELLIIRYRDFLNALTEVSQWGERTSIDIEDSGYSGSDEGRSLIVVDPVDPGRNVASPVSSERIGMFVHASREFLSAPSIKFFFPPPVPLLDRERIDKEVRSRGEILFISFSCPEVIDDILHPQLRMTMQRLSTLLNDHGFELNDSGYLVQDSLFLFFEFRVSRLPENVLHRGPKVYNPEHAARFLGKWKKREPFLKGDRWFVLAPVKFRTPRELFEQMLPEFQTGRYIMDSIKKGFRVLDHTGIPGEVPIEVISHFLDKRMPWKRD